MLRRAWSEDKIGGNMNSLPLRHCRKRMQARFHPKDAHPSFPPASSLAHDGSPRFLQPGALRTLRRTACLDPCSTSTGRLRSRHRQQDCSSSRRQPSCLSDTAYVSPQTIESSKSCWTQYSTCISSWDIRISGSRAGRPCSVARHAFDTGARSAPQCLLFVGTTSKCA